MLDTGDIPIQPLHVTL